mmetsp:Transcript_6398/g.10033  ORF Transcript_6398/g.10033 Transcript_6398/m.10033 type:complete len:83 (-) Transcript_6398:11-259(-)
MERRLIFHREYRLSRVYHLPKLKKYIPPTPDNSTHPRKPAKNTRTHHREGERAPIHPETHCTGDSDLLPASLADAVVPRSPP